MRDKMRIYLVLTDRDFVAPSSQNRQLKLVVQMAPNALFVVKNKMVW